VRDPNEREIRRVIREAHRNGARFVSGSIRVMISDSMCSTKHEFEPDFPGANELCKCRHFKEADCHVK